MKRMDASAVETLREEWPFRRAQNKSFLAALKSQSKGTAWKMSQGVLFRDFSGWFVAAPAAVWVGRRKTQVELFCKPMAIDPIFWEIVETESNLTMPLSFRHHGAWTCRTPVVAELEIDETSDAGPIAFASQALAWLQAQVGTFQSWTTEHFLMSLRQHARSTSYLPAVITTMCLLKDYSTAEALCNDAIKRDDACGFSIGRESGPTQSFPQLALAWLEKKRALYN